jgi:hypothetical protein
LCGDILKYYTIDDFILRLNNSKKEAYDSLKKGQLFRSKVICERLKKGIVNFNPELNDSKKSIEDAIFLGLDLNDQIHVFDFSDMIFKDYMLKVLPDNFSQFYKTMIKEKRRVDDLSFKVEKNYKSIYKKTEVYRWDNPNDSFFLYSVNLGIGQFVIPFKDRIFTKGFKIVFEKDSGEDMFFCYNSENHSMNYTYDNLNETILSISNHLNLIIINNENSKKNYNEYNLCDVDTLFKIGSEKYILKFTSTLNNDYIDYKSHENLKKKL